MKDTVGKIISSFIFLLFHSYHVAAQNKDALDILSKSLESNGGKALDGSVKNLRYTAKGHEFMIEQSERPDGPYLISYFTLDVRKDITTSKCLFSIKYAANARPYDILVDGERTGALMGKNVLPMYPETDEQIGLAPERIISTAINSNPRYMKDTIVQGAGNQVISFIWKQFPIRLFINRYTHLITGVEVTRYYTSNFNYVWGDSKRLTLYSFWHLEKNGMHYPYQSDVFVNGRYFRTTTIDSLQFDISNKLDSLSITDSSLARMQAMKKMIDPLEKPTLKPVEIAAGIFFIRGNWNTSYIKAEKNIYVIEAPVSSVYAAAVIEEIHKMFPNTTIAGVISTSDAWPHIGGLRTYAARKIPFYLLDLNQGIVHALLSANFLTFPDELSQKKNTAVIHVIQQKTTIGKGDNEMELYPMRTESGERMMVVYFPQKKLLYTSDMVQPSARGGFFMKQYLSEIKEVVNREGLAVDNIFGMHLPVTPYESLLKELK